MANTAAKKVPEYSIKAGAIQLSIWMNQTKKGTMESITINRTYKDDSGFKTTTSFRPQDLPLIEVLINSAMEYLYLQKPSTESSSRREEDIREKDTDENAPF